MSAIQNQWPSVLEARIAQDYQNNKQALGAKGLSRQRVEAIFSNLPSQEELYAGARACMERIRDFVYKQQQLFNGDSAELSLSSVYHDRDEYGCRTYNFKPMKFQKELALMLREELELDALEFREGRDEQLILRVQRLYADLHVP